MKAYRHVITITGDSKDLDFIYDHCDLKEHSQMERHPLPFPEKLSNEQMNNMLKGMTLGFGTGKIIIRFNSNPEQLKAFILKKVPNVKFE